MQTYPPNNPTDVFSNGTSDGGNQCCAWSHSAPLTLIAQCAAAQEGIGQPRLRSPGAYGERPPCVSHKAISHEQLSLVGAVRRRHSSRRVSAMRSRRVRPRTCQRRHASAGSGRPATEAARQAAAS